MIKPIFIIDQEKAIKRKKRFIQQMKNYAQQNTVSHLELSHLETLENSLLVSIGKKEKYIKEYIEERKKNEPSNSKYKKFA